MTHPELNIQELIRYDPITGKFFRKVGEHWTKIRWRSKDYVRIQVGKTTYLGHRLAWFLTYNRWPHQIDHINGLRNDNRLANLRETSQEQNLLNTRQHREKSNIGVFKLKNCERWRASLGAGGYIGIFKTEEEAITAYQEARAKKLKENFND